MDIGHPNLTKRIMSFKKQLHIFQLVMCRHKNKIQQMFLCFKFDWRTSCPLSSLHIATPTFVLSDLLYKNEAEKSEKPRQCWDSNCRPPDPKWEPGALDCSTTLDPHFPKSFVSFSHQGPILRIKNL